MTSVAVIPAIGIGDGLLMMIASEQLKRHGYHVTTFHHALPELSSWLPGHDLRPLPPEEQQGEVLCRYDLILVENDNSPNIRRWIADFRKQLCIFYPSYRAEKHAPLFPMDQVFDPDIPMADNIARAIANVMGLFAPCKDNGLTPPNSFVHRAKKEQILIHPTSRVLSKNWKARGFFQVARSLSRQGLNPLFCVGPSEEDAWGFPVAKPASLSDLAALIYESGVVIGNDSLAGHLASNLGVPTITIANDAKRMLLWRPGWLKGELILPPTYLPNWKCLRLREKYWQHFISSNQVLKKINMLVQKIN